jgi:hypothetical protein
VSDAGGDNPVWSRNGRELFYRDAADRIVAVEVTSGADLELGARTPLFSADGFLRGDGHPMYDVSPDATRFIMLEEVSGTGNADLVLVRNWFEELNRVAPR